MSLYDKKLACRNLKFRFHKAGEHIMRYKEVGTEFFILIKGKASVIIPKKKEKEEDKSIIHCGHDHEEGNEFVESDPD